MFRKELVYIFHSHSMLLNLKEFTLLYLHKREKKTFLKNNEKHQQFNPLEMKLKSVKWFMTLVSLSKLSNTNFLRLKNFTTG